MKNKRLEILLYKKYIVCQSFHDKKTCVNLLYELNKRPSTKWMRCSKVTKYEGHGVNMADLTTLLLLYPCMPDVIKKRLLPHFLPNLIEKAISVDITIKVLFDSAQDVLVLCLIWQ